MDTRINHVSLHAPDLERSIAFYVELLGAEPLPTPNFGMPVRWLGLGDTQLHLFARDLTPSIQHHLGITVEDLAGPYRVAERWDAFEDEVFGSRLIELPGDVVQLYLRDPAGNLVELDQLGVDRLPADLRARLTPLSELNPQSEDNMRGRLFLAARAHQH